MLRKILFVGASMAVGAGATWYFTIYRKLPPAEQSIESTAERYGKTVGKAGREFGDGVITGWRTGGKE